MTDDLDASERIVTALLDKTSTVTEFSTYAKVRDLIADGVFRGVMKAVAVYATIAFLVWLLIYIVAEANRYG